MTAPYRQYDPSLLEPTYPKRTRRLEDLAVELAAQAGQLTKGLHPTVVASLRELVRSMNCYYSNLIEGHRTTPRDIERALNQDLSSDPKQRDLQLEAKAHIEVQRLIDLDADWQGQNVVSPVFMQRIHKAFYDRLPDSLWQIDTATVVPGQFRTVSVQIGSHVPPNPKTVPKFLERFSQVYEPEKLSKIDQIIAVSAAHHRLLWIHPFLDGNGRVVRLLSHAYLQQIGIGSSLWSVSRGLARKVQTYRKLLAVADGQRQDNYDGRGNLTMAGLVRFSDFFLETCLDQMAFMEKLLEPQRLLKRMEVYAVVETNQRQLLPGSFLILKAVFLEGEMSRGNAAAVTGYQERQARSVLAQLLNRGLLTSNSAKGAVRLAFPVTFAEQLFPQLWTDL
ncbi:MAG: Fic family protein [Phormidesmis sp.]